MNALTNGPDGPLLTPNEAFDVARLFIENYWRLRGGTADEVGDLLAFMHRLADGSPADPAIWLDWLDAIEKIRPHSELH
ncbi:MAG: hypothetical protein KKG14_09690 [Alphaproteobacteria bacterium]|nr:hypothetical protein [Alphaproteobacteria bacterium]MBU2271024.1 hypothetical protein [Alphaproteobacteria bacterium]MBU2418958.1 hypothetical protein [Alphaproteobacteria bacterium]